MVAKPNRLDRKHSISGACFVSSPSTTIVRSSCKIELLQSVLPVIRQFTLLSTLFQFKISSHLQLQLSMLSTILLLYLLASSVLASSAFSSRHNFRSSRRGHSTPSFRSAAPVWRPQRRNTTFQLQDNYEGSTFFDGFDFFTDNDPTHGDVVFVDNDTAWNLGLVNTTETQAIIRVDNFTALGSGQGRNSVRIGTKKTYNGALFILDIDTMPSGCGTWPAFWTVSQTTAWPLGGEIDIIEGVNINTQNQMTLHTGPGCDPQTPASDYTGQQISTTCPSSDDSNAGCAFLNPSNASYGDGLNQAGGGVFAMHWDGGGVYIWQWTHENQPCDLVEQSDSPDPSTWGTPVAAWVADGCSPDTYLKEHQVIIETTLCGDWAGAAYTSSDCPGTCSDQIMDPSNFDDAVWTINYLSVFVEM